MALGPAFHHDLESRPDFLVAIYPRAERIDRANGRSPAVPRHSRRRSSFSGSKICPRLSSAMFSLPSLARSKSRLNLFERPSSLPTSIISAICKSIRSETVLIPFLCLGAGFCPKSISLSIWRAHISASLRSEKLVPKSWPLQQTWTRHLPEASLLMGAMVVPFVVHAICTASGTKCESWRILRRSNGEREYVSRLRKYEKKRELSST